MIKTFIYLIGILALHNTDFTHPDSFYHLFLPLVDVFYLIFLLWQALFFFTLNNFSDGQHYAFNDLVADIYDLRYDIQDHGLLPALIQLSLNIIDFICIFLAIFYYCAIMIDLIAI